jgi:hypothetical protein
MERTDLDTEFAAKVLVGWKKARNVGVTTKRTNFWISRIPRLILHLPGSSTKN